MAWSTPRTWVNGEIPTQTEFNTDVRDNMRELWHEVAYVEFTADVASTTATEAAPLDIVSSGARTYVANPLLIEFFCVRANHSVRISLWDDVTDLGRWWASDAATDSQNPIFLARRLTPTAASHTYKARLWTSGGASATVSAGAGGVATKLPGYIRVLQKGGA